MGDDKDEMIMSGASCQHTFDHFAKTFSLSFTGIRKKISWCLISFWLREIINCAYHSALDYTVTSWRAYEVCIFILSLATFQQEFCS